MHRSCGRHKAIWHGRWGVPKNLGYPCNSTRADIYFYPDQNDEQTAYISSDRAETTPLARGFRVVDELPFREKPLKAALQVRRIGTLTIKKRGVDVVPEELVRRMKLKGPQKALVVMTRVQGQGRAFLVERL